MASLSSTGGGGSLCPGDNHGSDLSGLWAVGQRDFEATKWKTWERIHGQKGKRKTSERIHRQKSLLFWKHFWLRSRCDFPLSGKTLWITWEILLHSGATFGATQAFVTHQAFTLQGQTSFPVQPPCILSIPQPVLGRGCSSTAGGWSSWLLVQATGDARDGGILAPT